MWFQNRRAKFRRNERSVLTQRNCTGLQSPPCLLQHDAPPHPLDSASLHRASYFATQGGDYLPWPTYAYSNPYAEVGPAARAGGAYGSTTSLPSCALNAAAGFGLGTAGLNTSAAGFVGYPRSAFIEDRNSYCTNLGVGAVSGATEYMTPAGYHRQMIQ